ncbi:DNA glycosylase [Xylariaceae sp. AK1471]|nr:DNA glycosylase [Xylariaceae sp. AK1471]
MRKFSISQNTIKVFTTMARARAAASPPRRITRSSLARFAHTPDGASTAKAQDNHASTGSPDIEDIIPDETSSSALSRKRKRSTASTAKTATRKIKKEVEENINDAEVKLEIKSEDITTTSTIPAKTVKRQRKPARKTTNPSTGESTISPPTDWEEIYDVVRVMRSEGGAAANAAVDTMGCERLAETTASPRDQRFQTLVALMLSSQTKDTVNAAAMHRLQTELPPHAPHASPGLNLENILAVSPQRLNELIYAVGFHNNKTKYLQQAAAICRDVHGGDIPDTIKGLVSLPGVGPKMAHLCLSAAWGRTEGIGVDVHVHRITNLWGWHGKGGSKNPEDTRAKLESWLPQDRWYEINTLLVGLGQTVCLPVGRRCGDCELGLRGLCPAAERKKVLEGRRVRKSIGVDVNGEMVLKVEDERIEEVERELVVNEEVKDKEAVKEEDGVDEMEKPIK